ncbi:hypothetical protein I4F81_009860 [Pyropia yezoensis]|uniref:Uncharacterized protein n=1 Tax=Pyropia yezoensis TaxID=2788 RepID=A0ACC3CB97_PYRYE|nr:hypothetical protein I4F81_009860 [Neopyropia yezoensis]
MTAAAAAAAAAPSPARQRTAAEAGWLLGAPVAPLTVVPPLPVLVATGTPSAAAAAAAAAAAVATNTSRAAAAPLVDPHAASLAGRGRWPGFGGGAPPPWLTATAAATAANAASPAVSVLGFAAAAAAAPPAAGCGCAVATVAGGWGRRRRAMCGEPPPPLAALGHHTFAPRCPTLGHWPPRAAATAVRASGPAGGGGGNDDVNDLLDAASRLASRLAAGTAAWARRHRATPEGRALLATVAASTAVFAAWRLAPSTFMARHFTLTPAAVTAFRRRGHTLVTSFFSHASAPHYAANMYMLVSFAPALTAVLPPGVDAAPAFAAVYLGGGVAGAAARLAATAAAAAAAAASASPRGGGGRLALPPASLGASGSVLALVYAVAAAAPDTPVAVLGVMPSTLGEVALGGALLNALGALRGWPPVWL